jgi:alpha-N-acetylglucosaminidase
MKNMKCDFLLISTLILKVGVGMSMEGIEQNPIVYDLMSEMAFHHRQVDLQVK